MHVAQGQGAAKNSQSTWVFYPIGNTSILLDACKCHHTSDGLLNKCLEYEYSRVCRKLGTSEYPVARKI